MRFAIGALLLAAALVVAVLALVGDGDDGGSVPGEPPPTVTEPPIEPPVEPAPADPAPAKPGASDPTPTTVPEADPSRPVVASAFEDVPIEGATLRLSGSSDAALRTDRFGQFVLPTHWAGGSADVSAPGFGATRVDLDADGRVVASDGTSRWIRLAPASSIRGRVVGPDGTPLDWVAVTLAVVLPRPNDEPVAKRWPLAERVLSRDGGAFDIDGLDPRGRYLVVARLSRIGVAAESDWKATAEPGTRRPIRLGGGGEARVVVVDTAGRPVTGAKATLTGRPDSFPGGVSADPATRGVARLMRELRVEVSRDAFFARVSGGGWTHEGMGAYFRDLPSGRYTLRIAARGYASYTTVLVVERGGVVEHLATLEDAAVAFRGLVVDDSDQPIKGAQVQVLTTGSSFAGYRTTASDAQGYFEVRGPEEWRAPLRLSLAATGHESRTRLVGPNERQVTVRLARHGAIYGTVGFPGRGAEEVVFTFSRAAAPPLAFERRLDLRGEAVRYQWDLPPGRWRVRINCAGKREARLDFDVTPTGAVELPAVTLQPK